MQTCGQHQQPSCKRADTCMFTRRLLMLTAARSVMLQHEAQLLGGETYQGGLGGDKQVTAGVIVGARLARTSAPEVEGECKHCHRESQAAYSGQRILKHHRLESAHPHKQHNSMLTSCHVAKPSGFLNHNRSESAHSHYSHKPMLSCC